MRVLFIKNQKVSQNIPKKEENASVKNYVQIFHMRLSLRYLAPVYKGRSDLQGSRMILFPPQFDFPFDVNGSFVIDHVVDFFQCFTRHGRTREGELPDTKFSELYRSTVI
jgi:hypothetical protein